MTIAEGDDLVGEQDVLVEINERLGDISRKMDRKFVRNLTVMILGVILAVVAIGVAVSSSHDAHRAQRSLDAYKAATQDARIGSCEQYNRHERDQAEIEVSESHDQIALFVAAASSGSDPAKIEAFVADYNRRHDKKIRMIHEDALRDCSAAGIRRYLLGTK